MQGNDKKQKQNNQYLQENNILKQMHEQRIKRIQQMAHQEIGESIKISQQALKNKQQQNQYKMSQNLQKSILLNMVIYDKRPVKPRFLINFYSLFQDQPIGKAQPYISSNIQAIVISTFGFEMETFRFLIESQKKCFIINDSNLNQTKIFENFQQIKNFTVIQRARKIKGYGVSHTKLWLIKFKKFLRVVVCTSNHHIMDWTIWLNAFWYQDFPLKNKNENKKQIKQGNNQFDFNKDFEQTLKKVINNLLPDQKYLSNIIGIELQDYQFENIQKSILIPSFQGRFNNQKMTQVGMNKVGKVIRKMGLKFKKPIMTYASTSLGTINSKFISELYGKFCPGVMFQPNNFRLIYPTMKYIMQQTCQQAQILFLNKTNYQKCDMKNQVFYKFDNNPANPILGCLPHLKIIFIQQEQNQNGKGILYMGSHNATKAAWGTNQKNNTQIYCCNEELGLLFIDYDKKKFLQWCPFKYPPEKYSKTDIPFLRD